MKVYICGASGCCPFVEGKEDEVIIGEGMNVARLRREEWNILVAKIKSGELDAL